MKNNITELVFILDRSGSMAGFEADTIGGFNATIEKQKKQDGKVYVSIVLFDNESKVIHDRVDISEIKPMTCEEYQVGGCTALLDAIGGAIVGGVSAAGGVGSIFGAFLGVLVISLMKVGLPFIGLQANWQQIITGLVLISAILIDVVKKKKV